MAAAGIVATRMLFPPAWTGATLVPQPRRSIGERPKTPADRIGLEMTDMSTLLVGFTRPRRWARDGRARYSCRSATVGSTHIARAIGTPCAASATRSRTPATATNVIGSVALTL